MLEELRAADVTTPAVVLKLDPNVLHHGGLGVIRSLGRLGVPVYGVHEGRWAPAASSRYLAGRVFWQPPPDDVDRIIAGLLGLARRIGRPAVLLPTDDAGAIFLAEHGGAAAGQFPVRRPARGAAPPGGGQVLAVPAVPGPGGAHARGPPWPGRPGRPRTSRPRRASRSSASWPPRGGGRVPRGPPLRSTTIIRDRAELAEAWLRCTEAGLGLMLQEFLPGGPGQDWFFHGYCDSGGGCSARVHRGQGPVLPGVCRADQPGPRGAQHRAARAAHRAARRARLPRHRRPRPAAGPAGRAVQAARLQPAAGRAVPAVRGHGGAGRGPGRLPGPDRPADGRAGQVAGRRFLVENYDPLGAAGYWRAGELRPTSWAASLRRVDELAWFARDDLRPFGLMCLRMGWRAASRPWTRGSSAQPRAAGEPRYQPGRAQKIVRPVSGGAPQARSRRAWRSARSGDRGCGASSPRSTRKG